MGKRDMLYFGVFFVILGCLLGLYKINALIPEGVLVSGIPEGEIEEMYQGLYDGRTAYDMGVGTGEDLDAWILAPKKDAEQILAFTLQKRFPDAYVRALGVERRMRLAGILFLSCIVLFVALNRLVFLLLRGKGREYRYLLWTVEFFLFCFLVWSRGELPACCIPGKFIFFGEWWAKGKAYFDSLRAMGRIPCAGYQAFAFLQWVFIALLLVGAVGMFTMRKTK